VFVNFEGGRRRALGRRREEGACEMR